MRKEVSPLKKWKASRKFIPWWMLNPLGFRSRLEDKDVAWNFVATSSAWVCQLPSSTLARVGVAFFPPCCDRHPVNMLSYLEYPGWIEKEATLESVLQQFKTDCTFFMIYERFLCKHRCHDHLVGGERWGADSALIPVPCSERSHSPPCLSSVPFLCSRLCWDSSFPSLFQRDCLFPELQKFYLL